MLETVVIARLKSSQNLSLISSALVMVGQSSWKGGKPPLS